MNNYLLEIGVEELPSRFVEMAIEQLKDKGTKMLEELNIDYDRIKVYATPRRLSLMVWGIGKSQKDIEKEIKGPAVKISFDEDGNPTKPLDGFMRSQNIDLEDIVKKEFKGEEYVYAHIHKKGEDSKNLLQKSIPELIHNINFPRTMKWGGKNIKFARPIRWIVSMLDHDVIDFELEGIPVSNITRGHRFLGSNHIEIDDVTNYEKLLEENYVILDQQKRREEIKYGAKKMAKTLGGEIKDNPELLEELTYIVEYPTPLRGRIKEEYLILPKEVITTTMIDHLRYIPVYNANGNLLPYFITIRNGTEDYKDIVIEGNEKVLGARLEDAKFFYEDDISKPLEEYVDALEGVTFHDKLGNMKQKSLRDGKLALKIGEMLEVACETQESLKRAAFLSKADLTTKMVVEFTELQGIMGSIYAKNSHEPDIVATTIREQYLPRHAEDALPGSTVGSIFSIADKLDTITGLFAIDVIPTGSTDPFGLRRYAIGLIRIIRENNWKISLKELIDQALYEYVNEMNLAFDYEKVKKNILEFFEGRIRNMLQEEGVRYDIIEAILQEGNKIDMIFKKAEELDPWFREQKDHHFVDAFVRLHNLSLKASEEDVVDPELFQEEEERQLYDALIQRKEEIQDHIDANEFIPAMERLEELIPAIHKYFDHVMVMTDQEEIRRNRLAMIFEIDQMMEQILNIEKIVTE
ncbi:MAG: glycine--tRNA ligase subunit beta [Tissierellia bacterium]|nr:glycine--tRNA ligase subunit beta [Tissierellia bacterium]